MSWLKEAQSKIDSKKENPESEDLNFFKNEESLIKELQMLYENATTREIEKAIDAAKEQQKVFVNKKELMNFFRIKLED